MTENGLHACFALCSEMLALGTAQAHTCFLSARRSDGHNQNFRHKDYELLCSARAVDGGRFVPAVTVSKQVWPTRPREIAVERGRHVSAANAIDSAYAQGVEWIVNYG